MALKNKLPVSYILFTRRGWINRLTYRVASLFIWTSFYVLFNVLEYTISYHATLIIYPLLFLALLNISWETDQSEFKSSVKKMNSLLLQIADQKIIIEHVFDF